MHFWLQIFCLILKLEENLLEHTFIYSSKISVNGVIIDVSKTTQATSNRVKKLHKTRTELPNWISGEVKKFDTDDLFVSESQSFTRIVVILCVISICEIFIATSFIIICNNLSKPILEKEWIIPKEGECFIVTIWGIETAKKSLKRF